MHRGEAGFTLEHDEADGRHVLRLAGWLDFRDFGRRWEALRLELGRASAQVVTIDLSGLEQADGGSLALLVELCAELEQRGTATELVGASARVDAVLRLYLSEPPPATRRLPSEGLLERTGKLTLELVGDVQSVLGFTGTFVRSSVGLLRRPGTANWRDVLPFMERAGADGLPIILLINFLVGLVMAFQGALQLKQFGANIYVADLVAKSVTRELGPLMTAIVVCGRSGASFAAELGTMKVNEEIDALRTMGFDPMRFLVFPRALALVLVMPILTLMADIVAIGGGAVVGFAGLDITVAAYVIRTQQVLGMWDVFSGVGKSLVFGLVISLIACQQGLSATGGAQGVGLRTTSSVVAILFSLIVVDACFTVLMTLFEV